MGVWKSKLADWKLLIKLFLFSAAAIWAPPVFGEQIFGYVYTTETLSKGEWEFEQTYWGKYGKSRGTYANSFFRSELEYGVTDNFQTAFYINSRHVYANKDSRDGTTGGEDIPENADPNGSYSKFKFETVSLEGIYRILSPDKDPFGLAIYLEPAVGPDKYEIEPKLIFQKNFLNGRLVFAINNSWELEWAREKGQAESFSDWEREMGFENTAGVSYRLGNSWWGGLEFINHNQFEGFRISQIEHNAYFLGPDVHYEKDAFEATATILFQLPAARGLNEEQREQIVHGKIYGDEHEDIEVRVKFEWEF